MTDTPTNSAEPTGSTTPAARGLDPAAFVGLLYLVMLAADLPLIGPLAAHDVLAPILVGFFLLRFRELGRLFRFPDVLLLSFGTVAVVATLTHLHGQRDVYELAVFGYMALLYLFYSRTTFHAQHLWGYGIAVGALMWLVAAYQLGAGGFGEHEAYRESTLSFLTSRFRFTFDNPNLFGSFVALPLACALVGLSAQRQNLSRAAFWKRFGLLALLYGPPVLLSASRHILLSGGFVLGWITVHLPVASTRRGSLRLAAGLLFLLVGVVFYLTILFPFFPLQTEFPYINVRTTGMYTIHQAAYAKMLFLDVRAFLFGVGPSHARALYSTLVDPVAAEQVLAQYHMVPLLDSFLSYMDAHCEYLNLATAFGVPAMLLCYAFLLAVAVYIFRHCSATVKWLAIYAVASLALMSLWDDILSKRWIWVLLGILASRTPGQPGQAQEHHEVVT